jgi:hypothetical protein
LGGGCTVGTRVGATGGGSYQVRRVPPQLMEDARVLGAVTTLGSLCTARGGAVGGSALRGGALLVAHVERVEAQHLRTRPNYADATKLRGRDRIARTRPVPAVDATGVRGRDRCTRTRPVYADATGVLARPRPTPQGVGVAGSAGKGAGLGNGSKVTAARSSSASRPARFSHVAASYPKPRHFTSSCPDALS